MLRRVQDAELARLAHLNMVAAFASLTAHKKGGFVQRIGGVVVAVTRSQVAFFNEVLPVDETVDAASFVEAVEVARGIGAPWVTHLREDVDDALLPVVRDLDLDELDAERPLPAMVLTELPSTVELPAGFHVDRVIDPAGFEDYLRTFGRSRDLVETWLGPGIVDDAAVTLFVGYGDGRPVATSIGVRSDPVIGVYSVGTMEGARRRGFGWAVTASAIVNGARSGCSIAVLQSSIMGMPMYEAHGFRTLFHYRVFGDRPAGA